MWGQLQGRVRLALELVLVIALALVLAQTTWLIAAPQDRVAMQTVRPLPSPLAQVGVAITSDRTGLLENNPFVSSTPLEVVEAPETQLNLKLIGARASTGPDGGSAQITTPDNVTQTFTPGEEILEGVVLERIMSDRIVIRRNGEAEILMRVGRTAGLSVIGDASQTLPPSAATSANVPQVAEIDGIISDPQLLMRTVRLTPNEREGRGFGYLMTLTGSDATLNRAGLRDGDILIAVNGAQVNDIDFSEIMDEMGAGQTANLRIERDGLEQTVRLRFNE